MNTTTENKTEPVKAKAAKAARATPVIAALTLANLGELHAEAKGLTGEPLRLALVKIAEALEAAAPAKVMFSSDKEQRKTQMEAFAKAKGEHQKLSRAHHQWLMDCGNAESQIRYSGNVSPSGIVTSREVNTAKVRPPKGSAVRY